MKSRSRRSSESSGATVGTASDDADGGESREVDAKKERGGGVGRRRAVLASWLLVVVVVVVVVGGARPWTTTPRRPDVATSSASRRTASSSSFVYGTKGKGGRTDELVRTALEVGFRRLATASMHAQYSESGVGRGLSRAYETTDLRRSDVYLQTLFVPTSNPDWTDADCAVPKAKAEEGEDSIERDVRRSVESSLVNLNTTYLDAVLYHNFRNRLEPRDDAMRAWRVLEEYVREGVVLELGVTNVHDESRLRRWWAEATVKPTIVQNRFHANRGFDVSLKPLLDELGVTQHQVFWTITGNGHVLRNARVRELATARNTTPAGYYFVFLDSVGRSPLVGTTNRRHMEEAVRAETLGKTIVWNAGERKEFASILRMNDFRD